MSGPQEHAFMEGLIQLIEPNNIIEVGVAHGSMSGVMARGVNKIMNHVDTKNNYDGCRYTGFDVWADHGLLREFPGFGSQEEAEEYVSAWIDTYEFVNINTQTEQQRFHQELQRIHETVGAIDFAFIDGDHSYHGIANDFFNVWPYMSDKGIVAFHDTAVIDGCREFILDLRRNNNGSYDVIDFPYGFHQRHCGVTLVQPRTFVHDDVMIDEVCGSPNSYFDIENQEREYYESNLQPLNEWWTRNLNLETRQLDEQSTHRLPPPMPANKRQRGIEWT
jgi:hypothetical protein